MTTIIAYSSEDEVLVCTNQSEPRLLKQWFVEGGRELDDFDREESPADTTIVEITRGSLKTWLCNETPVE